MNSDEDAMKRTRLPGFVGVMRSILAAILILIFCGSGLSAEQKTSDGDRQAEPKQVGLVPPETIPAYIEKAVNSGQRPAADKLLDAGRRPAQMLTFIGVKPGMKAADLFAGGGYTTGLLALVVGPKGKVYSLNPHFPRDFKKVETAWHERLKKPGMKNVVAVTRAFDAKELLPVKPGTLDLVIMNLNYHDLVWMNVDREKMNANIFRALKPGGIYAIVDHSAQAGSGIRDVKTLHRIDQRVVEDEVTKSGFSLAEKSSALGHPEDDRTWMVFQRRGETDRFMLKFMKS